MNTEKRNIFIIGANNIANINLKYHYWHFGWRYVILGCFIRLFLSFFLFWWILVEPISCKNGNEISRLINQFSEKNIHSIKKCFCLLCSAASLSFTLMVLSNSTKLVKIEMLFFSRTLGSLFLLFFLFFIFLSHWRWKQTIKKFIHVRRFFPKNKRWLMWVWKFLMGYKAHFWVFVILDSWFF